MLTYIAIDCGSNLTVGWDDINAHTNIEYNCTNSCQVVQVGTSESDQSAEVIRDMTRVIQ